MNRHVVDNDELNAIYNEVVRAGRNGNAKLNTRGAPLSGSYWSSSTTHPVNWKFARIQYLDDGDQYANYMGYAYACVRCIRDEPGLTLA